MKLKIYSKEGDINFLKKLYLRSGWKVEKEYFQVINFDTNFLHFFFLKL